MDYHYRRLYKDEYQPRLFSYGVRQPFHDTEGTLSIESRAIDGSISQPIKTFTRNMLPTEPMNFRINAGTTVPFSGHRFLHGWV
jgi:hypothetical protein